MFRDGLSDPSPDSKRRCGLLKVRMSRVPPSLEDFARRLLLHEAGGRQRTEDFADAMGRACQALHVRLTPLLSAAGVNALLGRANTLAARDFPFLAAVGALRGP